MGLFDEEPKEEKTTETPVEKKVEKMCINFLDNLKNHKKNCNDYISHNTSIKNYTFIFTQANN